jgi:hypothetical protein
MDDKNVLFSAEKSTFRPEKSAVRLERSTFQLKGTFSASILCLRIRPLDGNSEEGENSVTIRKNKGCE